MDFKEELQRQFVRSGMSPKDRDIRDDECTCMIVGRFFCFCVFVALKKFDFDPRECGGWV
jgi:hypothetical protein